MKVYLAGPIRDKNDYDIEWRRFVTQELRRRGATVMSPMDGQYELDKGEWFFNGIAAVPATMVPRDLFQLRQADVVLVNLLPLSEGYRGMGTLMELGVAIERRQLIVVVGPEDVIGHPWIAHTAYARFQTMDAAVAFLIRETQSFNGAF